MAENAGDRLMGEPPGRLVEQMLRACGAERHVRPQRQCGRVHPESFGEEDARISLGAIEAGLREGTAEEREGFGARGACAERRQAHAAWAASCAAWCSVVSASTISSRAVPFITSSSR